jgi:hypothetical protein
MAGTQIIRGTWDEIALRADELRGLGELTLIVPAEDARTQEKAASEQDKTLVELFAGRVGKLNFGPPDLASRAEEYFGQIVAEKRQMPEPGNDAL